MIHIKKYGIHFFEQKDGFLVESLSELLSPTVDYYPTTVGYYRVIAQKTLKNKSSHQDLLKTSKLNKIGSITAENDKNEKSLNVFFTEIRWFSGDLRSDNDIYMPIPPCTESTAELQHRTYM